MKKKREFQLVGACRSLPGHFKRALVALVVLGGAAFERHTNQFANKPAARSNLSGAAHLDHVADKPCRSKGISPFLFGQHLNRLWGACPIAASPPAAKGSKYRLVR